MILKLINHHKSLFYWLLGFDLLVLCLHLLLGSTNSFFHLDFEQNLPTVYQSFKLIGFGILFLAMGSKKIAKPDLRGFILPLAFVMTFLGLDELLQIHENIYRIFELFDFFHPSKIVEASMKMGYRSSLWILYYLPLIFLFVFWGGYWTHYFQSKMKNNVWFFSLAV